MRVRFLGRRLGLAGIGVGLLAAMSAGSMAAETTEVAAAAPARVTQEAPNQDASSQRVAALTPATQGDDPAVGAQAEKPPVSAPAAKPAAPKRPRKPTLHATIDLTSQRMTVKANGKVVYRWKISSGRAGYHTPRGTFRPQWMARRWHSRQYDGAPMPYSVFFNRGIATHGTDAVGRLGQPASHGCIRLRTPHARRFYNLVRKHGKSRTRIVVTGSTPATRTRVARRTRTTTRPRATELWRVPAYGQRRRLRREWHFWDNNTPAARRRARVRREYLPRRRAYWQRPAPRRSYRRTQRRRLVFPGD